MGRNSVLLSWPVENKYPVYLPAPALAPATVNSKVEFFDLWKRGRFGNRLMGWSNLEELKASGYRGKVSVRYKDAGGGFCAYEIPVEQVNTVVSEWLARGAKEDLIYFNESAPDDRLVIQGELMRTTQSYCLYYSREKIKMRDAMRNGLHAYGLEAKMILQSAMTPSSYEDIQELIDLYPSSVIEFGVYERCLGSCNNRNCVIWEVRNY